MLSKVSTKKEYDCERVATSTPQKHRCVFEEATLFGSVNLRVRGDETTVEGGHETTRPPAPEWSETTVSIPIGSRAGKDQGRERTCVRQRVSYGS